METEVEDRATAAEKTEFSRPSELENEVTRLFHAPPDRVFRFFTDPATLPYAFASDLSKVTVEKLEVRPGGHYSVLIHFKDGPMRFSGEYREIDPPRRIVNTFEASIWPGVVAMETDTFERVGDFTRARVRYKFASREDRDRMEGAGGEGGIADVWDYIDRLLQQSLPSASDAKVRA